MFWARKRWKKPNGYVLARKNVGGKPNSDVSIWKNGGKNLSYVPAWKNGRKILQDISPRKNDGKT